MSNPTVTTGLVVRRPGLNLGSPGFRARQWLCSQHSLRVKAVPSTVPPRLSHQAASPESHPRPLTEHPLGGRHCGGGKGLMGREPMGEVPAFLYSEIRTVRSTLVSGRSIKAKIPSLYQMPLNHATPGLTLNSLRMMCSTSLSHHHSLTRKPSLIALPVTEPQLSHICNKKNPEILCPPQNLSRGFVVEFINLAPTSSQALPQPLWGIDFLKKITRLWPSWWQELSFRY